MSELPVFSPGPAEQYTAGVHVVWPHDPAILRDLVWSYQDFTEFVPGVEHSQLLAHEPGRVWVYQRLKFPPPFNTRHYVIESTKRHDRGTGHYAVEWQLSSRFALPEDKRPAVVPQSFSGCWDIRPGDAGGVDAIYAVHLQPGGLVPDWAARAGIEQYLVKLMRALRRRLDEQGASQGNSSR